MIRWKITQKLWHWKNTSQEAHVRLEDQWGLLFRHPPSSGSDRNTLFGRRPRTHIGCRFYCCRDACFEDGKGASVLVFPCSPIGLSSWWPCPGPLWTTALQDTQVWGLSPVLRDVELLPSPVPFPSSSFGVFCVMSKAHKALLPDFVEQIKVLALWLPSTRELHVNLFQEPGFHPWLCPFQTSARGSGSLFIHL